MARFFSSQLVRLDGAPGYVECDKVGDVTVVVAGVRTIVASGDVEKRLVIDKDRESEISAINTKLQALETECQDLRTKKRRIIAGL